MIAEFLRAAFFAGVPVAVVSYLLVWWGLRSEYFEKARDLKQFEKQVSGFSRAQKKQKKADATQLKKLNPVHNKWLKFGGGFYGVVALMTFVIVELGEIISFLGNLSDNLGWLRDLSPDLFINFFIDQIMNFVTAIAWPKYWIDRIHTGHIWIWFAAAYGGYWLGARAAIKPRDTEGPQV